MSEAKLYTKEEADSSFASKSHSHSNYVSASNLMTTIFTGFFADRSYFTCYIPSYQFQDWNSLVNLLKGRQCSSHSTSLGCWGLLTNASGQSLSIIGLYLSSLSDPNIVFDCQGPTNTIPVSHPMQGGTRLSGRYHVGVFSTYTANKITWVRNNATIPTSY